ncbi:nitrogen fixation sigma-54 dependent transcriptional regulator GnfM [Venenivibrio stagnispumantis]|uniref:Two-component system, NtrC family, response regulator PilR n=1 Tax=Venenivibrio stagnispumantis TaxID=407998 RepID=A0AA45WJ01_9AQUI|nr:sigma-54 dependent transcriptional regulator [Venenivibrio stagnispumantis]MCW4572530.1 sigma-54 dependent transcriptional regulator [Venenivibrio stagnispumantis]SMP01757.1 two-component system, NtrC family, response regulator PilR [Venenivibrio stagnispumantis]
MKTLILDDEKNIVEILSILLKKEGFDVDVAYSLKEVEDKIYDIAFIDLRLPDGSGIDIIHRLKQKNNDILIVMITAFASPDTAVEALKRGAYDYISKPFDINDIKKFIKKVKEKINIQNLLSEDEEENFLVGNSTAIRLLRETIKKVAPYDINILITGETGTGKEVTARVIHKYSNRKDKPFVAVNCAAIPSELLESELFGYKKGAFTGAEKDKIGLIEEADGGTLFLDEIAEMPLPLQAKLLRFLEERKIRPLGTTKEIEVDVRIISATNKDLKQEIEKGNFREDLYYRLSTIHIQLPPLRKRKEDIPILISQLLKEINKKYNKNITKINPDFIDYVKSLELKGNVRELKNIIEKAVILAEGDELKPVEYIKPINKNSIFIDDPKADFEIKLFPEELNLKEVMDNIEKSIIKYVYEKTRKNKTKSAQILGLTFREFRYRYEKYFKD